MEIREVQECKTLAVNMTTPVSQLPEVIGEVYGEILRYMGRKGISPSGAPYVLYRNMDMEALDVEIGFPVGENDPGEGRVEASALPGGKAVTAVHKGPYSSLENAYNELMAFVAEQGVKTENWMYETYLNSPEDTPEAELLTEIFFPVAGTASV